MVEHVHSARAQTQEGAGTPFLINKEAKFEDDAIPTNQVSV